MLWSSVISGLLLVVGKLRQLHKALVVVSCHRKFDLQVLPCSLHPALSPFSQPTTSHQSSKLHPDPDGAVLCRCPMWRPFPSLFRNNWYLIAIRMPQHAPTPWTALARPEF